MPRELQDECRIIAPEKSAAHTERAPTRTRSFELSLRVRWTGDGAERMTTMGDASVVEALAGRLAKLHEKRPRAWGKMTAHEMLCHLADAFEMALGERPLTRRDTWIQRNVVRRVALHSSLAWPRGLKTIPELEQAAGGTPPGDFAADRERVLALMRRFAAPGARLGSHPFFGPLTRDEWMVWGYRHTDHHLRQFAL